MLMFLFQLVFIILGIVGFFTPIASFMTISLIGLIICDIVGFVSGSLKSFNMDFIYVFIAIILWFFIDREFWEILSITFAICGAIESILGILLMMGMNFFMNKHK